MKKRIISIITSIFMVVAMMPSLVFAEQDAVNVSIGSGGMGTCTVTFTDGKADLVLDYQTWLKQECNFGKKIAEEMNIDDISDPAIDGDSSGFLGWVVNLNGDDEDLYPAVIAGPMSTDDLKNYIIPTQNPLEAGEAFSISIEAQWDDGILDNDWADVPRFAVSGNSGKLLIKDEMDGTNKTVNCYDSEFFSPDPVRNAVPFKIISAEKKGAVLSGWTVYEADAIIFDEVEASKGLNFGDPDMEILLHNTYTNDSGVKMNVYISLLFAKIIDSSMSTEELYDLGGNNKSYYAVANWTTGTIQEMTINNQPARLEIANDIVAVNSNLKVKFKTSKEIKNALQQAAYTSNKDFNEDSMKIEYMEIVLKIKNKDGIWETATPENFPENGIEIVIPYPAGANKDSFTFSVLHMFTHGSKAGSIEVLAPELKEDGLHVSVHSLSPFAVAYQESISQGAAAQAPSEEATETPSAEPQQKDSSPKTGDDSNLLPWVVLMVISAAVGTLAVTRRRFN